MIILSWFMLLLDLLAALSVLVSFPIVCLTTNIRLAACLFSTGLVLHFILHGWFGIESSVEIQDDDETPKDY